METWGKKKEKGLFRFVLWNGGKETPHRHDMNMEGRERTWRERKEHGGKGKKEQGRGKERKRKEICQDFPVFSTAGVRQVHACVRYLKSRNHDLLKELDGNYGIIEGTSLMSTR